VLIDFNPTAVSGFTRELLDRKAVQPTSLQGCPAREAFYLMVGPDSHDRIMACHNSRRTALDNRIAIHNLLGVNDHLLRRRAGSTKWELVLTTGAIIPIHDAVRGDVGLGEDSRKMGYIILNRERRDITEIGRKPSRWYRPEPGTAPPEWDQACLARLQSAEISLEAHVAHLTARDWLGFNTRRRLVTDPGRPAAPRADSAPTPPAASGPAPPVDTLDADTEGAWPETLPPIPDATTYAAPEPAVDSGVPAETI
jgi:hypothetical protein